MTDETDRSRAKALVPTQPTELTDYDDEVIEFDPADYDWVPVLRAPRADGWSRDKQRLFIQTLADTGSVSTAARAVGKTRQGAYALRRAPDAAGFAAAWDIAIRHATAQVLDAAMDRAINGVEEPIFQGGQRVGTRIRYNDRLAMFMLRAHRPETFARPADDRGSPPAALPAVEEALAKLDPPTPPDPHLLMPPEELGMALTIADLMPGELPRWHRDNSIDPRSEDPDGAAELDRRFEEMHAAMARGED